LKLSPNHLKRYKEIARIFWKYGRSDLVQHMGNQDALDPTDLKHDGDGKAATDQLADDLEAMGPTYVKLGQVLAGFQKIANRITTGIVLGALILGACMLMRVESSFRLFGYPGLAIVCFLLATTGGFWLVITILVKDHRTRKKPPQ